MRKGREITPNGLSFLALPGSAWVQIEPSAANGQGQPQTQQLAVDVTQVRRAMCSTWQHRCLSGSVVLHVESELKLVESGLTK